MTYEVQFQLGDAQYTVIGPDIDGVLTLIQGVQGTEVVPEHEARRDAAEATLKRLKYEWRGGEQWAPPIGQPPIGRPPPWVNEPEDPHAELRKSWAPGQRWETRPRGVKEWMYVGGYVGGCPEWHPDQEYRQCA